MDPLPKEPLPLPREPDREILRQQLDPSVETSRLNMAFLDDKTVRVDEMRQRLTREAREKLQLTRTSAPPEAVRQLALRMLGRIGGTTISTPRVLYAFAVFATAAENAVLETDKETYTQALALFGDAFGRTPALTATRASGRAH